MVPRRIVSLLPSATEIVCALGAGDRLVGRSHECDFPADVAALPILTSTEIDPHASGGAIDRQVRARLDASLSLYHVDVDRLAALEPELIVTQDHCDVCAVSASDVDSALGAELVTLSPHDLASVLRDFRRVAAACGVSPAPLLDAFERRIAEVRSAAEGRKRPRVLCLEWLDPPMIAGGYIPELVGIAGGEPLIVDRPTRFATVSWSDVHAAEADVVVVMACGFDIPRTLRELSEPVRAPCFVTDGNAHFNRPGPRLMESLSILSGIFGHSPLRGGAVAA